MNLYKREGRKFVKTTICDNTGKYYQKDGTFINERTEDSIGLCIISNINEHVVISLESTEDIDFGTAKMRAAMEFNGHGEIPKLHELTVALILFKDELRCTYYQNYWAINPKNPSDSLAALVDASGSASYYPTCTMHYIAMLRSIVRIKN